METEEMMVVVTAAMASASGGIREEKA